MSVQDHVSLWMMDDTFLPASAAIFTKSLGFCSEFDFAHFRPKHIQLGHRAGLLPEWFDGCTMVFIPMEKLFKEMNVAPSNIWNMHTKMNHTYGAPQFSPWFLGWFLLIFPMISNKEAECLEGWPKNTLHQLNHVLSVNLSEASEAMTSSSRLPHVV